MVRTFKIHFISNFEVYSVVDFPGGLVPMQETQVMWVLFLGQEDPLKEMATHSTMLG